MRAFFLTFLATLSVLFAVRAARASIVLAKPGGDAHVSDVRLAIASAPTRSVVWEQLVLDESRGDLVWLVAVPKGGWIEGADARWFEALDEASAPVIAPAKSLGCGGVDPRESTFDPPSTAIPRAVARSLGVVSGAKAIETLIARGYAIDAATRAMLEGLDAAGEEVAMLELPPGPRGATRVVRVLGPGARPVPLALLPAGAKLRLHVLTPGRPKLAGLVAIEPSYESLTWGASGSNYRALFDAALAKAPGGVVVPSSSADVLFADQPGGALGITIPSLMRRYFGADESASTDVWACAKRAAALGASSKSVAPSCAKAPTWPGAGAPPTCSEPTADSIAPTDLACGAKDDLGVALGGLAPSKVWLTRFEGTLAPIKEGRALEPTSLGTLPPFHEAKATSPGGCGGPGSPPTGGDAGPTTPPPRPTDPPPDPGAPVEPLPQPAPPQDAVSDGCAAAQVFADGCSRSGSSGGESSGGCGSSSSSSSNDGCDGDSGGGGGCDGDSSDSSGCDSSSSSGSDNGCSGSSSSGSSGGCSGGSKGADNGCRVARGRMPIRTSALLYLLVAVGTVVRRYGRKR